MAKLEKVLQVNNSKYPFGDNPSIHSIRVQQKQFFTTYDSLLEKKSQMLRKKQMIDNPAIINLLSVTSEGSALIYEWQYVPHSLSSYIRSKFTVDNKEIWQMTRKLFLKKITFQLTVLMSYLAKMRIQTQLSSQTLGIRHDEKLKLYLSPRTKMGIRTELFLISQYGQAKQRILKQLQGELQLIRNNPENPNFKGTRPYFESKMLNTSMLESIIVNSCTNTSPQPLISQQKEQDDIPLKRKMSVGNFEMGNRFTNKFQSQILRKPKMPNKNHKLSFNLSQSKNLSERSFYEDDVEDERSNFPAHSKSIRIELEQQQILDPQRKRKDSYKVKITTCREYEVKDPYIFKQTGGEDTDIFQYFAKKAKNVGEEEHREKNQNECDQDRQKEGLNTTTSFTPPPSPLLSQKSNSQKLNDRVREVRERSEKVLLKMRQLKK